MIAVAGKVKRPQQRAHKLDGDRMGRDPEGHATEVVMNQRSSNTSPKTMPVRERSPLATARASDRGNRARAGFSALENDFFDRGIELMNRKPEAPDLFEDLE